MRVLVHKRCFLESFENQHYVKSAARGLRTNAVSLATPFFDLVTGGGFTAHALRQRMLEDLRIRAYASATVRCHVRSGAEFAQHFNKPPDQFGADDSNCPVMRSSCQ